MRNAIKSKIDRNPLTCNNFFYKVVSADEVDFTEETLKEGLSNSQLELYEKNINEIHQARYDNLFYRLRCFIVHELRLPTPNALDLNENSDVPIYYCFASEYRLWFSPKIISLILEECIKKLEEDITYDYENIFEPIPKCWINKKI